MKYTRDISIVTVLMFQLIISAENVGLSENVISLERNAFDDQYVGCEKRMQMKAKELLAQERARNSNLDEAWVNAENIWKTMSASKKRVEKLFEIAVIAYTMENSKIYKDFNKAVRKCCKSREAYMKNFHFKALHFYLTTAVQILRRSCINVYRGISVKLHHEGAKEMRFGQFSSTSLKQVTARRFPETSGTLFKVYTCEGAAIEHLSVYPDEREVLIPPYEVFSVSEPEKNGLKNFELQSTRTYSKFNCAYLEASANKVAVPEQLTTILFSGVLTLVLQTHSKILI
ncbi:ecto-ADP-ribosyltransferase 5-like [Notamacropus eugenii]|uniref:ecto-ADP-ribosyltransferase 5-like n=1 Tax=Notamacropus eugenii TaxID=9315 RepID=UPI003B67090B